MKQVFFLFVACVFLSSVRSNAQVDSSIIITFAGGPIAGYSGDGGLADTAKLKTLQALPQTVMVMSLSVTRQPTM